MNKNLKEDGTSNKTDLVFCDAVYGHIPITPLACSIIDTKEFQRLRRIKQLSMGSLVFPCAEHTRFSHSLGAYYVMTLIVDQLSDQLNQVVGEVLGTPIEEKDWNLVTDALTIAALLHDLGHGPFSHSFERILRPNDPQNLHEEWTQKIISDTDSDICTILKKYSLSHAKGKSEDYFKNLVLSFLDHNDSQNDTEAGEPLNNALVPLRQAFASLISSNLDADRLDYLQRDALFCGAVYGSFDLHSILRGLKIIKLSDNTITVAVTAEKISDLEGYLFLRAQMYKNVYYKHAKVFAEDLLVKIFEYAKELFYAESLSPEDVPSAIRNLFEKCELSVKDYCNLDDYVVMGTIRVWSTLNVSGKPTTLALMCQSLLERNGYSCVRVNNPERVMQAMRKAIQDELIRHKSGKRSGDIDPETCILPFWTFRKISSSLYGGKDIRIVLPDGRIVSLLRKSPLLQTLSSETYQDNVAYWSSSICKHYLTSIFSNDAESVFNEIEKIIHKEDFSNRCEFERKYQSHDEATLKEFVETILTTLTSLTFTGNSSPKTIEYTDSFFDTHSNELSSQKCEVRIRQYNSDSRCLIVKCTPQQDDCEIFESEYIERNRLLKEIRKDEKIENLQEEIKDFLRDHKINIYQPFNPCPILKLHTKRKQYEFFLGAKDEFTDRFILNLDEITYSSCKKYLLEIKFETRQYSREPMRSIIDKLEQTHMTAKDLVTVKSKFESCSST